MAIQFENLRQQQYQPHEEEQQAGEDQQQQQWYDQTPISPASTPPTPITTPPKTFESARCLRSARIRRYEHLNRNLERITERLKQISHANRTSRHFGAIVGAIDALSEQFANCSKNFEHVSQKITTKRSPEKPVTMPQQLPEKTYADWVHEMRHTSNGQKFLYRIESSLRKALNKQKQQQLKETEIRLLHQKQILKLHYRQKLLKNLAQHPPCDASTDIHKFNEKIEKQLKRFEEKHERIVMAETPQKLSNANFNVNQLPTNVGRDGGENQNIFKKASEKDTQNSEEAIAVKEPTSEHPMEGANNSINMANGASHTQKHLKEMIDNIADQERSVDQIVLEAKMRIRELENESNQLEQSFRNYLERQQLQKEATRDTATRLLHCYAVEREKMRKLHGKVRRIEVLTERVFSDDESKKDDGDEIEVNAFNGKNCESETIKNYDPLQSNSPSFECKNAILEAKRRFFEGERKFKEDMARIGDIPAMNVNIIEETNIESHMWLGGEEPYLSNCRFRALESQTQLVEKSLYSPTLNAMASKYKYHTRHGQKINLNPSSSNNTYISSSSSSYSEESLQKQPQNNAETQNNAERQSKGKLLNPRESVTASVEITRNVTLTTNYKGQYINDGDCDTEEVHQELLNGENDEYNEVLRKSKQYYQTEQISMKQFTNNLLSTEKVPRVVLQQTMEKMQQLFSPVHNDEHYLREQMHESENEFQSHNLDKKKSDASDTIVLESIDNAENYRKKSKPSKQAESIDQQSNVVEAATKTAEQKLDVFLTHNQKDDNENVDDEDVDKEVNDETNDDKENDDDENDEEDIDNRLEYVSSISNDEDEADESLDDEEAAIEVEIGQIVESVNLRYSKMVTTEVSPSYSAASSLDLQLSTHLGTIPSDDDPGSEKFWQ